MFMHFYFRFGCVNLPENVNENVIVEYSLNNGNSWSLLAELLYDRYHEARCESTLPIMQL